MKILTTLFIASMFLAAEASASDPNSLLCQRDSVFTEELDAYVNLVIYEPEARPEGGKLTPIIYLFGDFLFESFAGSLHYLQEELELIPNCILIGINEIPGKQIGPHQEAYTRFIGRELMEHLSSRYELNDHGVLFGHSRASRLVGRVMQENPGPIDRFILSAPWFTEEHLVEMEQAFSERSEPISIYYALSEEDLEREAIEEARENLTKLLHQYGPMVRSEYQYFEGETHMSIPPLSFYFGIKYLLQ